MFLYRPVLAGLWQQHQVKDGTYNFKDLLIAHDLLNLKEANQQRYEQWVRSQQE